MPVREYGQYGPSTTFIFETSAYSTASKRDPFAYNLGFEILCGDPSFPHKYIYIMFVVEEKTEDFNNKK
jgi:hypothetical protein